MSVAGPKRRRKPPSDPIESRRLVIAFFVCTAALIGGTAAWTILSDEPQSKWVWSAIPLFIAPFPGKYLIFTTVIEGSPIGPWQSAFLAVATDLVVALGLAVGLGWLERFAWIERSLKRIHDSAEKVLVQFPRFKRMAFAGVVFFVFLPLPASGAIGGTFLSQFVGLKRTAGVLAVTLGGILVSSLFALLAQVVGARGQEMMQSPWALGVSVVALGVFVWWVWTRVRIQLQRR